MGVFGQYLLQKMFSPSKEELLAQRKNAIADFVGQRAMTDKERFARMDEVEGPVKPQAKGLLGLIQDPQRQVALKAMAAMAGSASPELAQQGISGLGAMVQEMAKRRSPTQNTVNFDQYQKFSPEQRSDYDAFKGRGSTELPSELKIYNEIDRIRQTDPGKADKINQWLINRKKAGAATTKIGGNEYVSADEANKLVYIDGGKNVTPFTPKSQLVGKVRSITQQEQKERGGIPKASRITDELDGMLFGNNGIYNEFSDSLWDKGKLIATSAYENIAQQDPRFRSYDQYREGVGTQLVRSMGEVGATSDTDIARVDALFPQIGGINPDSPSVAKEKLQKLKRLLGTINDIKTRKAKGENITLTSDMITNAIGGSNKPQSPREMRLLKPDDKKVYKDLSDGDKEEYLNWIEAGRP